MIERLSGVYVIYVVLCFVNATHLVDDVDRPPTNSETGSSTPPDAVQPHFGRAATDALPTDRFAAVFAGGIWSMASLRPARDSCWMPRLS